MVALLSLWACERKAPPGARTQSSAAVVSASQSPSNPAPPRSLAALAQPAPKASATVPASLVRSSGKFSEVTWSFEDTPVGDMRAVVVIPAHASPNHRLPVVIVMHGQGEALKGPEKGARGWVDDYDLPTTLLRLAAPPLTERDFHDRVHPGRLEALNDGLAQQPYQGLIVVCPYTPHRVLKGERAFTDAKMLADFLVDVLIPKVYAETPSIGTPATTGVDGVSLGGRAAVLVGLMRPEAFGSLGALQPAFDVEDAKRLAKSAKSALEKNPKLRIRLLTSEGDFYLESTKALSAAMRKAGVDNTLDVVAGDHSYAFNRGPGGYEMLLFHDRALRAPID